MIGARKLILLAAIAAAAFSTEARADEPLPFGGVSQSSRGWYLRGQLGLSEHHQPDIVAWRGFQAPLIDPWSDVELSESASIGGGIGFYVSRHWRADVTLDHRWGAEASGEEHSYTGNMITLDHFSIRNTVALVNLYYDLGNVPLWKPYIGAGIGWSHNETFDGGFGRRNRRETVPFLVNEVDELAAALMGGVAYQVTEYLAVDAGYRLLYMGGVEAGNWINGGGVEIPDEPRFSAMVGHELRVGLRYDLPW